MESLFFAHFFIQLNHPHIIRLFQTIESEKHLFLVLEYASGGEVFDHLATHGRLRETSDGNYLAQRLSYHVVLGLQHCHQHGVAHRDLKAENLLLTGNLRVKVACIVFVCVIYSHSFEDF